MKDVEWTQAERIANIERLYASGDLTRYRIHLPRRFAALSARRSWAGFFGRRSSRRNVSRHRHRVLYGRLLAMRDSQKRCRLPWGRYLMPRPYARLRDAFLGDRA